MTVRILPLLALFCVVLGRYEAAAIFYLFGEAFFGGRRS